MKITLIQDIIYWADKAKNLEIIERKLYELAGRTELVVLPEMFTTGFCTNQLDLAESMDGETISRLRNWAKSYNIAIAGSFIATENNKFFNRGFFVFPDGEVKTADKRHLFSVGGENEYFSAGNDKLIVRYCDFNIRLLICYDIRFPVWSRNQQNEYDLLIYVANFPQSRIKNWDVLLQARAIENQAYVCGLNCVGTDGLGIQYNGHSVLLDYKAGELIGFAESESGIRTYDIQMEPLLAFRQKSAFWKDADQFTIH